MKQPSMKLSLYKLLLSPAGRIDRQSFWIGMAAFAVLVVVFNFALGQLGNSVWAFLISLPFPFIALHMAYSIYGKRLHDMGRSFWPLTGMIVALLLVMIIVMLKFGGSDYFAEFAQYERKADIDPAVQTDIQNRYQARLAEGNATLTAVMYAIIGAFTLWCGTAKADTHANVYGEPTS